MPENLRGIFDSHCILVNCCEFGEVWRGSMEQSGDTAPTGLWTYFRQRWPVSLLSLLTNLKDNVSFGCYLCKFVIDRGGLPIIINGRNFDSIYGYFGNPVAALTGWPYIGIWVGPEVTGGPEFVDTVSEFPPAKSVVLCIFIYRYF